MGNSLNKILAAVCLLSTINASAQTAAPQSVTVTSHKNASAWFRAESRHFVVMSDSRKEDVTQLLNNLEKLDHLLRIYTKDYKTDRVPDQKISLYFHDRIEGFNQIAAGQPEEAVGLYNSCGAGVQGFGVNLQPIGALRNDQLVKSPLNTSLSYLFEAYTRHFLYRYTDIRSPVSYIDGLAQYFSGVRFSDNQLVLGRPPLNIGYYLAFLDQGNRYRLTYQDIFEPNESTDPGYKGQSGKQLEYLARSWILTHYMLSSSENRDKADKYLNLVHHDVPTGKAFETAFGLKVADVSTAMWRYRVKGVEVAQVDLPSMPTAHVSFTSLPDASTDFILADAALKACPSRKEGEALLQAISQKAANAPANSFAKLTLSRAQIDWGNAADALPFLQEATRKDASNAEALYLLGLANLRLHERHPGAAGDAYLQAAKRHLARARTVNPASAEAAYAFYRAELGKHGRPGELALEGAIKAWNNAHEVNTYARSAALAFAYAGRGAEADNALTLIAHNARDPDMAKWAKTWQARLGAGVGRAELLAEMRRETGPHAFKEWTLASEHLMKDVVHQAGMENARNYSDSLRMANPMSDSMFSTK